MDGDAMTYYEKLVQKASEAMEDTPRSTVIMDAESLETITTSALPSKAALAACQAVAAGRTPVIVEKPRHEETWIL